jgi:hypothetical protein
MSGLPLTGGMQTSDEISAWGVGVIKWVKESYGFIECSAYLEDLFYHRSSTPHALFPKDKVRFRVVRNPLTVRAAYNNAQHIRS